MKNKTKAIVAIGSAIAVVLCFAGVAYAAHGKSEENKGKANGHSR